MITPLNQSAFLVPSQQIVTHPEAELITNRIVEYEPVVNFPQYGWKGVDLEAYLRGKITLPKMTIDIVDLFDQQILEKLNKGMSATTLMTGKQKEQYIKLKILFDDLTEEMLETYLKNMGKTADEGFKNKMRQWLTLMSVNVFLKIEIE